MTIRGFFLVLPAALLLFLPLASSAGPLELGLKAGINYASLSGDYADLVDAKSQTGYVVGPFLSLGLLPSLGLQGEALFSAEGAKTGGPNGHVDLKYVEVPVLLRWTLLPGPVKPFVYAGPSFGFSLGGKAKSSGFPDRDLKDQLRPVVRNGAAGAGVRLDLLGIKLLGDLRYTRSLQSIYDEPGILNAYNSVWTLSAGIVF